MLERELKLHIPQSQQAAVKKAVTLIGSQPPLRLAAQYFDTAQRCLARQAAALRLRLEGDQWVQTLKMRGPDELSHVEYNHLRPEPHLDLSLYADTDAAPLFENLVAPLEIRYQTDVQRTLAVLKQDQSEIEVALDLGVIKAKGAELPLSEIEFELKSGDMAAVFQVAAKWLKRFELIIELRSKSERGDQLYQYMLAHPTPIKGAAAGLALAQKPYRLPPSSAAPDQLVPDLYTKGASDFLSQVIRNTAFLAGIDGIRASKDLQASYLTLMRVGMRRLRSCRQLFKPWLTSTEIDLAQNLREHYKEFGLWRDKDMLWLELQPKLIAAGLPAAKKLERPKSKKGSAPVLAASVEYQSLLLQSLASLVLQHALKPEAYQADTSTALLNKRVSNWLTRIQTQSRLFDELPPAHQHDLRNEIKRLRYSLEVLGYEPQDPLYAALSKAQDHLGDLCDAYVAYQWYEANAVNKAQRAFAYTWLDEKIEKYQAKSKKTLLLLQEQRLKPARNT